MQGLALLALLVLEQLHNLVRHYHIEGRRGIGNHHGAATTADVPAAALVAGEDDVRHAAREPLPPDREPGGAAAPGPKLGE